MGEGELVKLAESVQTEADFLRFAHALLTDRRTEVQQQKVTPVDRFGRGPNGWENHTIEEFLFAMIRWLEDVGNSHPLDAPPDWGYFAFALLAGSQYE